MRRNNMAITKPFSWSYTALTDFENCPRAYAAKRVYKTVKEEETEALRWGNAVHEALEHRIKNKQPLPDSMKQWDKYAIAFETSPAVEEITVEGQYALDRSLKEVGWFDEDAWFRGKIDVQVLKEKGTTALIYDWKTGGRVNNDETQLRVFALATLLRNPGVERVYAHNIWLKHGQISHPICVMREWQAGEWNKILPRVKRMEDAWKHETFPERPSGLCKNHCPVLDCVHNGRRPK